eukprot:337417_1
MSVKALVITGYLRQIVTYVPTEITKLCIAFFIIPKSFIIRYKSTTGSYQTTFAIATPKLKQISKQIIVDHGPNITIQKKSLCFIHNLSYHLRHLPLKHSQSFQLDFTNKSYDGFFCFIYDKIQQQEFPSFILYESKYIYNSNNSRNTIGILLISNIPSMRKYLTMCKVDATKSIPVIITDIMNTKNKNIISMLNISKIISMDFQFIHNKLSLNHECQTFIPQPKISYEETLNILLNGNCCIGVYDEKCKYYRPAVYINHWDKTRAIMIRYVSNENERLHCGDEKVIDYDKFKMLKDFPVNYVKKYGFEPKEGHLCALSNVPKEKIKIWKKYKKNKTEIVGKHSLENKFVDIERFKKLFQLKYYYYILKYEHYCCDGIRLICSMSSNTKVDEKTGLASLAIVYDWNNMNTISVQIKHTYIQRTMNHKPVTLWWFDGRTLYCAFVLADKVISIFYFGKRKHLNKRYEMTWYNENEIDELFE